MISSYSYFRAAAGYIFLFVLSLGLMAANTVLISEFKADVPDPDKNEIQVIWTVQNEENVMHYNLKRKMSQDNEFMGIAQVQPLPPGQQQQGQLRYEYLDRNVFRSSAASEPVVYELEAVFTDGERRFIGQAEVNYTSTAVRRTWGSIKAMFQ